MTVYGEAQNSKQPSITEQKKGAGAMAEENLKRLSSLLTKDIGFDPTWEVTEGF